MSIFNEWFPLWIGLIVLFICCLIPFLIPKPSTPNYHDLIPNRRRPGSASFDSINIKKRGITSPVHSINDADAEGSATSSPKNDKQHTVTSDNPDKLLAKWEIRVTFIIGSLVCCYVMWACAYLAQVNPMITPIYKEVHK